ncbi:AzlC family ABC transporter permease [Priestia megaterium]|uniref:AzlC family ABC transporter permease n=1 Tax=Priestia megaterium TaxID=1404 RepID=UPI0013E356B8|nr:AzlC family ABC transporter permease [Priestia megaterium]MCM3191991.1 AzlC family ABC transporter permease [Priestia megaterium]MDI3093860.1 AzlC family ABC transporter permease [Priestia megaterium]MED3863467.1 AzlC family ABC transporter permease [Priestia megaterium]MED4101477.1 AzlC family ABC transporter permease [Priestia megaterium]MED4144970.1 AzlC family ABC transporter permease [Priestia megaterium]
MIAEKTVQQREKMDLTFRQGAKDCIPTLLGYISIGLAAGVVGVSSHLSVMEVALLSALVYAGAAQFIICALMVANSSISAIILTTFIVNLRHFLLSATVAPKFTKYSLLKNVGIGVLLTDESFGVSSSKIAKGEPINDRWMNGLNITAYVSWIIACTTGAIFGHLLSNPEAFGFDFALTAMFLALLVLQIESVLPSKLNHYLRLILYMAITMIVLSFLVPSHMAVLISTIIVATIGVVTDK